VVAGAAVQRAVGALAAAGSAIGTDGEAVAIVAASAVVAVAVIDVHTGAGAIEVSAADTSPVVSAVRDVSSVTDRGAVGAVRDRISLLDVVLTAVPSSGCSQGRGAQRRP
jgi:hypothetical protein